MGLWIERLVAPVTRGSTAEDYVVLAVKEDVSECLISEEGGQRIKHLGLSHPVDTFEIRGDENIVENLAIRKAIFLPSSHGEILFATGGDLSNKVLYARLPKGEETTQELVYVFAGHRYDVTCFAATADRLYLATCDEAGSIR